MDNFASASGNFRYRPRDVDRDETGGPLGRIAGGSLVESGGAAVSILHRKSWHKPSHTNITYSQNVY